MVEARALHSTLWDAGISLTVKAPGVAQNMPGSSVVLLVYCLNLHAYEGVMVFSSFLLLWLYPFFTGGLGLDDLTTGLPG